MTKLDKPANSQIIAELKQVTKRYPGVLALDNVDFSLYPGEVRALLGKNGAGKSTLIRMLTGSESPDSGTIIIDGKPLQGTDANRTKNAAILGVRAVYQELSLIDQMSVAENLFLGEWPENYGLIEHKQMVDAAQACLDELGVAVDPLQLVEMLSPAQKQLVEIARVLKGKPKLVILDEPTSSLATTEVELVAKAVMKMSQAGIAVVYVSHRMNEIRQLASSATIMRDGKVAGNVSLDKTTTEEIVDLMLGHKEHQKYLVSEANRGEVVLTVENLSRPPKLKQISFELHKGEVLGIAGLLGAGRTELLRAICGLHEIKEGKIVLNDRDITKENYINTLKLGVAYTPENRKDEGFIPLLGVDENIIVGDKTQVSQWGIFNWDKIKQVTKDIIKHMHIKVSDNATHVVTLSGGNQQKVVIGRWVYANSQVLLLDEPTRGVDVEAKNQIYQIVRKLAQQGKSIIFISSEAEELPQVCDRILLLQQGRLTKEFVAPVEVDSLMAEILQAH